MIKTLRVIFLCLFCFQLYAHTEPILSSLDNAKILSKETGKPILLIFGEDYCMYCVKLKNDLLSLNLSPETDDYIVCYIDIKKHPGLKRQYGVSVIPDSRIIKDGVQIQSNKGYSVQRYRTWLKNAE